MIVVVSGATGFIGRALVAALIARGDRVRALTRDPTRKKLAGAETFAWDATQGPPLPETLAGADAVVSLAGEGIADRRWTEARKRRLYASRVEGTRALVEGIRRSGARPKVFVAGSASGYYGARADDPVDETAPPGDDFLARLCVDWEAAADPARALECRVVKIRTGLVLGPSGGLLGKMLLPFTLGLGGPIGAGRRWMPWIHLDDEVGLILHAIDSPSLDGPVNAVAGVVTNRDFTRALARAVRRPARIPVPPPVLRLALGEMADLTVLASQRVVPEAARASGYKFRFTHIDDALAACVR